MVIRYLITNKKGTYDGATEIKICCRTTRPYLRRATWRIQAIRGIWVRILRYCLAYIVGRPSTPSCWAYERAQQLNSGSHHVCWCFSSHASCRNNVKERHTSRGATISIVLSLPFLETSCAQHTLGLGPSASTKLSSRPASLFPSFLFSPYSSIFPLLAE